MDDTELLTYMEMEKAVRDAVEHWDADVLTDEGREAIEQMTDYFSKGYTLEQIADYYDSTPENIQILLVTQQVLEEKARGV